MSVKEINFETFKELVAIPNEDLTQWKFLGKRPCIVDFYAAWCGPCQALAPVLDEVAKELGDRIDVYKVSTDKEEALANTYRVRSIPTLMFCPMEGAPQFKLGALSKAHIKELVEEFLQA